jgi:hypothetical protein
LELKTTNIGIGGKNYQFLALKYLTEREKAAGGCPVNQFV